MFGSRLSRRRCLGDRISYALHTTGSLQVTLFLTVMALILSLSISLRQNADGILLTIMSIQKLTPYYWAQDRYANLTPLLAAWVHNPVDNLYLQVSIHLVAGIVAPVFYCSLVLRRSLDVWRAVVLTDGLLLVVGNDAQMHEIFSAANPYSVSLACAGLASLALRVRSGRFGTAFWTLIGAVGLVAAYMSNFGMVIVALPLVGLFAVLLPSFNAVRLLVLNLFAAVWSYLVPQLLVPQYRTDMGLAPSLAGISHYARVIWSSTGWSFAMVVMAPMALLVAYLVWSGRRRALRLYGWMLTAMLAVTVCFFLLVASSRWLSYNLFHIRYFVPGYLLLVSMAGAALWLVLVQALRRRSLDGAAFVGMAGVLCLAAYCLLPTQGGTEPDIFDDGVGAVARAVAARYVSLSLDGIAGDYWLVWPSVLMTQQYYYDLSIHTADVIGIASRAQVRREHFAARLAAQGHLRLACIDLAPNECGGNVSAEMGVTNLHASQLGSKEALPGQHWLWLIELSQVEK